MFPKRRYLAVGAVGVCSFLSTSTSGNAQNHFFFFFYLGTTITRHTETTAIITSPAWYKKIKQEAKQKNTHAPAHPRDVCRNPECENSLSCSVWDPPFSYNTSSGIQNKNRQSIHWLCLFGIWLVPKLQCVLALHFISFYRMKWIYQQWGGQIQAWLCLRRSAHTKFALYICDSASRRGWGLGSNIGVFVPSSPLLFTDITPMASSDGCLPLR